MYSHAYSPLGVAGEHVNVVCVYRGYTQRILYFLSQHVLNTISRHCIISSYT